MFEFLNKGKDYAITMVLRPMLEKRIQKYGQIRDLTLDSAIRRVEIKILPLGELDPVTVTVEKFDLVSEGSTDYVVIRQASASRPWIGALIEDFLVGKKFVIPERYAGLVKAAL